MNGVQEYLVKRRKDSTSGEPGEILPREKDERRGRETEYKGPFERS